jgi:hypothetical protein
VEAVMHADMNRRLCGEVMDVEERRREEEEES